VWLWRANGRGEWEGRTLSIKALIVIRSWGTSYIRFFFERGVFKCGGGGGVLSWHRFSV